MSSRSQLTNMRLSIVSQRMPAPLRPRFRESSTLVSRGLRSISSGDDDPHWGNYETVSLLNRGICSGYVVIGTGSRGSSRVTRIYELIARDDDLLTYQALLSIALKKARREELAHVAVSSASSDAGFRALRRLGFRSTRLGARCVLNPYDDQIRQKLGLVRMYQSLGDRDYL